MSTSFYFLLKWYPASQQHENDEGNTMISFNNPEQEIRQVQNSYFYEYFLHVDSVNHSCPQKSQRRVRINGTRVFYFFFSPSRPQGQAFSDSRASECSLVKSGLLLLHRYVHMTISHSSCVWIMHFLRQHFPEKCISTWRVLSESWQKPDFNCSFFQR